MTFFSRFYNRSVQFWLLAALVGILVSCSKSEQEKPEKIVAASKIQNLRQDTKIKYSLEQLDNTKGLSNSSVNCIFQDSQNLIWIGTWDGLNRYDGNNFQIFRPQPDPVKSLSNQVILKIGEDFQGQIWVLTMHGINRYDKKTGDFQQFYFSRKNKPPLSESEFNMALDADKRVYCAVKDWGIGYFDGQDFRQLQIPGLPAATVRKLEFSKNGEMLALFADNRCFSIPIEIPENKIPTASEPKLISSEMRTFDIAPNGTIAAIGTSGKVDFLTSDVNPKADKTPKIATSIVGHVPEGFVFSGRSGYFISDENGNLIASPWLDYLKKQKVTTLLQASENVLWTGTDGDGVFKIYPRKKSFSLVSALQIPELDGGIVRSFLDDGDSFWVGTKGRGLIKIASDFYQNPDKPLVYKTFTEATDAIDNAVFALCKGNDNLIYIGTDGDGMTVYDQKSGKIVGWRDIDGSKSVDYFKSTYAIYQDKEGFIWLGTNGYGIVRLKIERLGDNLKIVGSKRYVGGNGANSLSSNIVFSIVPKGENELWIGTRLGGLNLFDKNSGNFKAFKNVAGDAKSLSNNDVLCLMNDASGKLWIGTSFGLNRLEKLTSDSKAEFKSYTVKDGLPDNTIHGIVSDGKSNLWISTNFGLSNFVVNPEKFINYSRVDGLQNNEFADGAFYFDNRSQLVFMGGIKGFNYFLPQQITESTVVPDLFIDKISGQNQAEPYYESLVVSPKSETHPSIVLNHDQNFFDIQLSALTYINSDKCRYAYKLEGFDKEWNAIDNRKIISFTNVPRGNYELFMKWSNSDGVWSDPVRAIDIRVKPVIWQSNVALAIYLILGIFFVLFVRSYYLKKQSLKQNIIFRQKEEEIHENRLSFFTNIAHEFLTPLTLIVGPIQKLSETSNLDDRSQKFVNMIQRNSSRLLFLTQQLLEFRKAEYEYLEVTVKKFDFVNLIEQIAELFDDWAFDKKIDYNLEIPQSLSGWFDKDKTEKIVFNLMSNAFKYTPIDGKISVKAEFEDENRKRIRLTVTNTGKGIPKEKMDSLFDRFFLSDISSDNEMFRTGIGLAYIKKLVTVLRGEILVSSVANEQTVFTILLPCDQSAFTEKEIDLESSPVQISHHLKNILEEISDAPDEKLPEKISALEQLENDKQTILIVEDEKEIHAFLHDLLSSKYNITTAYNGAEALEIVGSAIPDLIISDVMMPIMDGVELCRKIKTDLRTCHIPFIMLTAKDQVVHRIEGLESGANSYIPKPFYPEHLLVRIHKLLEEKSLILRHFTEDLIVDASPSDAPVTSREKDFIRTLIELIRKNIDSENLQSGFIERELGISASQLFRKTKDLFGLTPTDLIRSMRLKFAAELLRKNVLTVSEVCYKSGFNNRSYFYREFNKVYKMTPKNYQLHYKSKTVAFSKN
ncbi:hybrid sensor histidine kinase/response regulator transcription factor [Flavobacterium sp.]|uniref:hybrid sensor histidine kinase/response regulator transcription factor n=1 Tax=Flavobacterium sp. TaxID=239 RepID=UPI001207E0BC|nr:hybrid sensor histidine kinase/response regulator transcription factor [Flavobacterium sp.]RZJ70609.1 MAG: hybrid sensor histidine kinase/response regulator [Flavobacterium sp.]